MRVWVALLIAIALSGCEAVGLLSPSLEQIPSAESTPEIGQMEAKIRVRINQIRQQYNLEPLSHNDQLAQVARQYSQQMSAQDFFSHTSPDGKTPATRVKSVGVTYRLVGENLFKCTNIPEPVPAAVQGWMDSPGHRKNILRSEYQETGIGVWREGNTYYITQLFLRKA